MKFPSSCWPRSELRVWLTAVGVATCVAAMRFSGVLQFVEFAGFDQLVRLRPQEPTDDRIVIVGIDDRDIRNVGAWPMSDATMANLLRQIRAAEPRAIGLDIYRDLPIKPGNQALERVFASTPNLIGIEKIAAGESMGVMPPPVLAARNQVGFNNTIVDGDGRVRRGMLYWTTPDGKYHTSFALALALRYLDRAGIAPQAAPNSTNMQLGQVVFEPFRSNDGGYVRTDARGYQFLANFHLSDRSFQQVSMSDVIAGKVNLDLFRDRIVLIGSTADSLKDAFFMPLSDGLFRPAEPMPGVELQAHFIRQILDAALYGRSLLQVWPEPIELLWIFGWSYLGATLSWRVRKPTHSAIVLASALAGLGGICYMAFLGGWWLPLVPSAIAFSGSSIGIVTHLAQIKEELKKSKEFLSSIINAIPDPVFVKNRNHQWIVLNDAYCRLVGQPIDALLEKTDRDFFAPDQAAAFWKHDDLAFISGGEQESEEIFTDAQGVTYSIATKRSLHRDSAGNVFLVGVIRDITQRKRVEDELRRTAEDLVRSNAALRQSEIQLRQLALHDGLTKLPNRQLLQERLEQAIDRAHDREQLVVLLFLDLDGFKQINDSFGHRMGDLLLKAVAQRLAGCLRGSDTVARMGGDEFVVLLPAISSAPDISIVAEKLIYTLSQPFSIEGEALHVTTSVGISIYPIDSIDSESLMTCADQAMYQAKQQGKNCYEFFRSIAVMSH
ncbi:CHASE2 domain-containing protein [Microcoleus sp. FACHB-1515]|uniref:CHASE2 domain-containing protein n=1 Tax=Cyanophyceae TaxID=3028117 RepID=UPI001685B0D6|nr:CHASE2 domain-containing protein [Microcoleus sp. FACHB-1515]MBD2092015.1 CHASE2 domain-containing protein [Microcoleus sp. FACHB-1515]